MSAARVVIVCPNPSLDRTIEVERVYIGAVHRSFRSAAVGGGKGINVARALRAIGRDATVVGLVGGSTGDAVRRSLEQEGIELVGVPIQGETRSCLTVLSSDSTTVFNEAGPSCGDGDWSRLVEVALAHMTDGSVVVCSGSFPVGIRGPRIRALIDATKSRRGVAVVDAGGDALVAAAAAGADVVTPNLSEARSLLGRTQQELVDVERAGLGEAEELAASVRALGAGCAIVTAGASGAALAGADGTRRCPAPQVEVVNPIGAGDCLVAGVVAELSEGGDIAAAFHRGVAMAAAGCETFIAGALYPRRVEELLRAMEKTSAAAGP